LLCSICLLLNHTECGTAWCGTAWCGSHEVKGARVRSRHGQVPPLCTKQRHQIVANACKDHMTKYATHSSTFFLAHECCCRVGVVSCRTVDGMSRASQSPAWRMRQKRSVFFSEVRVHNQPPICTRARAQRRKRRGGRSNVRGSAASAASPASADAHTATLPTATHTTTTIRATNTTTTSSSPNGNGSGNSNISSRRQRRSSSSSMISSSSSSTNRHKPTPPQATTNHHQPPPPSSTAALVRLTCTLRRVR
jgi:hypothetical protein